jgi:hypothetical protein
VQRLNTVCHLQKCLVQRLNTVFHLQKGWCSA